MLAPQEGGLFGRFTERQPEAPSHVGRLTGGQDKNGDIQTPKVWKGLFFAPGTFRSNQGNFGLVLCHPRLGFVRGPISHRQARLGAKSKQQREQRAAGRPAHIREPETGWRVPEAPDCRLHGRWPHPFLVASPGLNTTPHSSP